MTKLLGQAQATAEQMASYLLSVNASPKITMPVRDFCQLFLDMAVKEGVRGDVLFAQSCKETGNFKFTGSVKESQNNYAGLGAVNAAAQGAVFDSPATGILAQAQHAKGYAAVASLNCPCVDPRYSLLVKYGKTGTAPNVEELGGKWAVPGYDTKKYASLEAANAAGDSYGYQIRKILDKILSMPRENREETKMNKIIAIDAGHGMNTAGKRCLKSIDPNQTREWYLNDRIADRLQELLADYDCRTIRVDDTTGAKDISLAARVKTANNGNADVYVSIHHNAGISGGSGGGTMVFHFSQTAAMAAALYQAVTSRTGLVGNRAEKVKKQGFYVLKNTRMPAVLIENGFMDSTRDTPVILTATHAEKTAQGILAFLVEQFGLELKTGEGQGTGSGTAADIYYPAYTGKKTTLSAALTSLGIASAYSYRKQIAKANNITGYVGTAAQNTRMYNLLVAGLLKKA